MNVDVVEGDALTVADRRVGEGPLGRPLVAEHRPQDLLLDGVVPGDRVDDALRRDDRHVVAGDQLGQAAVVVRMRVRQQHRAQRLPQLFEPCAHRAAVGDGEQAVDRDHAGVGLDEVGVHERPLVLSG